MMESRFLSKQILTEVVSNVLPLKLLVQNTIFQNYSVLKVDSTKSSH